MTEPLVIILATAILSSFLTVLTLWLYERRMRRDLERRLKDWHDEIGRTVEMRVKRAVIESLADMNAVDVIRDTTWKAARSGSDLLSDGISVLLGKRRKQE
jgi:membrane protein implicated in regulation of membrane protease activity